MSYRDLGDEKVRGLLKDAKKIAVVGLSDKPDRTSYQVAEVLKNAGYKLFPVNPTLSGTYILGELVYASLEDIPEPVDIVDVFRRSEALVGVAEDFLKMSPVPPVFWAQLGLMNDEAADLLYSKGIENVIMNRCIKIELKEI